MHRKVRTRLPGGPAVAAATVTALTVLSIMLAAPAAAASTTSTTTMAGLKLVPTHGPPGTTVRVTGTWFAGSGGHAVEVRWGGGPAAPVLATVRPDAGGTFITSITVPGDAAAGPHVIAATQLVPTADGRELPAPGTPARAAFTVGAAPVDRGVGPVASPGAGPDRLVPLILVVAGVIGLAGAGLGARLLLHETWGWRAHAGRGAAPARSAGRAAGRRQARRRA